MKVVVEKGTTSIAIEKHFSILETRPELKDELITLLKNMHVARQGLFAPIVQPIIRRIFESRVPDLLKDFTKRRGFKIFLEWTRDFMKYHLNWSYRATTITARKLPLPWEVEGTSMAHQVAYRVKMYNIPPCLVINTNQIGVPLVPIRRD